MYRPTKDQYFLMMARVAATRATCAGRKVGCVLVDSSGHILSTGYNGVPADVEHCSDTPCPGVEQETGVYTMCQAIHAEQNAVARCLRPHDVHTAYCTLSPCTECVKLLLATTCRRLVYSEWHPASGPHASDLWRVGGGVMETFDIPERLVNFCMWGHPIYSLSEAPCDMCGYNGPGYFQIDTHPCNKLITRRSSI